MDPGTTEGSKDTKDPTFCGILINLAMLIFILYLWCMANLVSFLCNAPVDLGINIAMMIGQRKSDYTCSYCDLQKYL